MGDREELYEKYSRIRDYRRRRLARGNHERPVIPRDVSDLNFELLGAVESEPMPYSPYSED